MSEPYRPPWYPNDDPRHNPWAMNGETGSAAKTLYAEWCDRVGPEELQRLIAEHHEACARVDARLRAAA
jgi:hypothetical protein